MSLSLLASVPAMRLAAPVMQMQAPPMAAGSYSGRVAPARGPGYEDAAILVQGGSLRTWSYRSPAVEQVQVILSTEGRPLDADIELWHGPERKMRGADASRTRTVRPTSGSAPRPPRATAQGVARTPSASKTVETRRRRTKASAPH